MLEGVKEETAKIAWKASAETGQSMHKWLDELVKRSFKNFKKKNEMDKKGKIFSVKNNFVDEHYSQIPTILLLDDRMRVYFATREVKTESKTTFIDLDIKNPKNS